MRKIYGKTKTRFTTLVRIDPKTLAWLKQNKDTKTVAGFLDKIINTHRLDTTHYGSKIKDMTQEDKDNALHAMAMYGHVLVKDGRVLNTVEMQCVDIWQDSTK